MPQPLVDAMMLMLSGNPEVGPPEPTRYPIHQVQGLPDETRGGSIKDMAPLVAAQILDLLTTEAALNAGAVERNPLPGMQSSAGRVGWGALEAALAHYFTRNRPKLREAVVGTALPGIHGALSMNNAANSRKEDVLEMVLKGSR